MYVLVYLARGPLRNWLQFLPSLEAVCYLCKKIARGSLRNLLQFYF
jgi:hypothetical protein